MSSKELYMIQNDKGEYLGIQAYEYDPSWNNGGGFAFVDMARALEYAKLNGGHIVPLVEKPKPVKVTEEEAEMLKRARNTKVWRPASVIAKYAYEHERQADDEVLLEDRLMRAYVNGYTVKKEKKYNVKVPHTKNVWYYKSGDTDLLTICPADKELRGKFTESEIEHYGLQDCEKLEVKTND